MAFEETIRSRIAAAPQKSREKDLFKLVLGEVQQKPTAVTEEQGHSIVKTIINSNKSTLGLMGVEDPRRAQLEEENVILGSLLPTYLTTEQIATKIAELGLANAVIAAEKEERAMGVVMPAFKRLKLSVEGDTVKEVIRTLRS